MKILILSNYFSPVLGGVSRFSTELARTLASQGIQIDVLTEKYSDISNIDRLQKINFDIYKNFNLHEYSGYRNENNVISALKRNVIAISAAKKLIKQESYDMIIVTTWRIFGTFLSLFGEKYLLVVHGSEILCPYNKGGIQRFLVQYVLRRSFLICSNSHYTKKIARNIVKKEIPDIDVIGCGVTFSRNISRSKNKTERYILSIGTLSKRKGFDLLIMAFSRSLYSKYGKLLIVGDGPEKKRLLNLVSELKLFNNVQFKNYLNDEELCAIYENAEIFAMLNREVNGDYEGFGIVFLEAASYELPVIGGNNGGVSDAIINEKTGFLVDPYDIDGVAAKLNELFMNHELREKMGMAARDMVMDTYSWARVAERILKAWEIAVGKKAVK